jgi:hypothetical protein
MLLWRFWMTLANDIHNLPHDSLSHFLTPLKKAGSRQVWCFFAPRYAKCVISLIFYVMSMRRVTWLVPAVLCDCQVCTCRRLIAISNMLSVVSGKNTYIYIYTCIWGPCFWTKKMKRTCFLKELREEDGPKSHVACYLLAALESHIQTLLSSGCLTQSFIFNMCAELCMFDRSASSILARKSLHAQ